SNNGKGRVFQSDGKEVKLTLTGYFWRYGIRKAIQVSIFRMNRLYLESRYKDGSGSTDEMTESQLNNAIKLVEKGGNPHGEYFVLDKNGQLQAGGNNGLFLKYKKLK
ncbi:hypothetical protein, partial [Vibrio metschnikovii]|uniref:hypothetical protein n=1 Tax=Vibrio metschnikovii TaxID=28172 RepID=UPI001C309D13